MRIVIDLSGCVGVGSCEAVAPDPFEVTDHADLRLDVVPGELGSLAERAVAAVPGQRTARLRGQESANGRAGDAW